MKKTLTLILVLILCLSFGACGNLPPAEEDYDYSASEMEETVEEAAQEIILSGQDEEPEISELSFTITAGEAGDYGTLITYNQGTEFEETFYAYYIPYGTYKVTNKGDYMTQINVYSDETSINENGWEEPVSISIVKLVDVECFEIITVEDGQHIEILEPSVFEFVQQ